MKRSFLTNGKSQVFQFQGARRAQEDRYFDEIIMPGIRWVAVFDGHGGSVISSVAPAILAASLVKHIGRVLGPPVLSGPLSPSPATQVATGQAATATLGLKGRNDLLIREAICEAFLACDARLYELYPHLGYMGTTVSGALIFDDVLYLVNLGDSVCALLGHASGLMTMTQPHKPDSPEERQRIQALGGTVVGGKSTLRGLGMSRAEQRYLLTRPDLEVMASSIARVNGNLAVSRSLGDWDITSPYGQQLISKVPTIDSFPCPQTTEPLMIVAATDGLTDLFSDYPATMRSVHRVATKSPPSGASDAVTAPSWNYESVGTTVSRMNLQDNTTVLMAEV